MTSHLVGFPFLDNLSHTLSEFLSASDKVRDKVRSCWIYPGQNPEAGETPAPLRRSRHPAKTSIGQDQLQQQKGERGQQRPLEERGEGGVAAQFHFRFF